MVRFAQFRRLCVLGSALGLAVVAAPEAAHAQQDEASESTSPEGGLLSDDFARDNGAIIVIGQRPGEGNLFEPVETPKDSCLANAPSLGTREPGFSIDASGFKKIKQLENIRRKTRAGTIFVSGGSFVGADLRKAQLYNMCFFGTDFSQSDWSGLSAAGLGFVGVDLTGAKMAGSHLPDVLLRDTKLALVNAAGARWMQGRIDGGWQGSLRGLDLSKADLTDFRIVCGTTEQDGCPVERGEMLLNGANLRRASIATFFASDLTLTDARIDQTELALDHLVLIKGAKLAGPVVLRSARRAVMLFPQEIAQLVEVAEASDPTLTACEDASSANAALAAMCELPGSDPRRLLRSVSLLEGAAGNKAGYAAGQTSWLANRDACLALPDPEDQPVCLIEAYRARQSALRTALGAPQWLSEPGYRLFLSREAAFPTNDGEPGLYGRILPVLLDTAVAAVMVRTDGRGGVVVKGVAPGGCGFETSGLSFDVATARFGFKAEQRQLRPRRGTRRPPPAAPAGAPLLMVGESEAEVLDEGLARASASCAGDNPFPPLAEIALDERLLGEIWERF